MAKAKWPDRWLMTDERMGDQLFAALDRLTRGTGVVLRHHDHPKRERLAHDVAGIARRHGLVLAVSRDMALARAVGAQMVHNPDSTACEMPFSMAVHSLHQAEVANRYGAALAFVSPLFATRSHPDARPLSRADASRIVKTLACPAIALGGVDAQNYASVEKLGFSGWAGIDAWLRT